MDAALPPPNQATALRNQVRRAVIWRSGSQFLAQLIQWGATFAVIRILSPADYGLFAMTQVVLLLLNMVNGYGLASALIRQPVVTDQQIRQLFGLLIAVNVTLAAAQALLAPVFAAYYRQPLVADLLRVQALLYLVTPFVALPQALLSRGLEFSAQAKINVGASLASAGMALTGALAGWGVWTLVAAPLTLFVVRGIGLTIAARAWMLPSFRFGGTGQFVRYGGLVAAGQLAALLWSQADVFIGGRVLSPHLLGIYSTSLFLVQIFVSKFVPPLNEVAFAAYARLQDDRPALARAFLQIARVVMVAGMPFYLGLAATAGPLVLTVLGPHWAETAPVVRVLALGMPFYTVYVLFSPATDAIGRPGVGTRNGFTAALLAPPLLLLAAQGGMLALAATWLLVFPTLLLIGARRSLPLLGIAPRALADAVLPPAAAAIGMALVVVIADSVLPPMPAPARLGVLVATGGLVYGAWLMLFARQSVRELIEIVRRR